MEEFHQGMKRMGLGLTDEQLRDVVYELDLDKDGEVDFEEFVSALQKDFDSFNPMKETEKRLEKVKKKAREEEAAITHLCGSFATNKSARVMQEMADKRKRLEARMARKREKVRQKFSRRRQQSREKWGQVMARSPYGIDLHQEHKMIMKNNADRNKLEARLKKRRERSRQACLKKVILEAISDADKLNAVRRERRELAQEEARLRAMVDIERARRMGLNSKYHREKLSRQKIRAKLAAQERMRQGRGPDTGRQSMDGGRYGFGDADEGTNPEDYEGQMSGRMSGR